MDSFFFGLTTNRYTLTNICISSLLLNKTTILERNLSRSHSGIVIHSVDCIPPRLFGTCQECHYSSHNSFLPSNDHPSWMLSNNGKGKLIHTYLPLLYINMRKYICLFASLDWKSYFLWVSKYLSWKGKPFHAGVGWNLAHSQVDLG